MGEVINIKDFVPMVGKNSKESDLAMLSVLYFIENFAELHSEVEIEVRYALIISIYRYMVAAERAGEVEINEEGFSIDSKTSQDLRSKIKRAVDMGDADMRILH